MSSTTSIPTPTGQSETGTTEKPGRALDTSDIIGIAVGVPSGILALISAIIAFCAWKYPKSSIRNLGNSVRDQFVRVWGGDARGGDASGDMAYAGDAYGGQSTVPVTGGAVAHGGSARGGDATGREARGGAAIGGHGAAV
ncbi:hypothetical protein MFIFM68171_08540 [Madurella fahalii]|uniref:Uncharacterized protein n=1 Tax=Madurella fahalii TaxID=1157608 RepID=A0ABQ0GL85_9PEZI